MTNKDTIAQIKLFTLANSITEHELDNVENSLEIDLGRKEKEEIKRKDFYLQFSADYRKEAKLMGQHYEVFYCLEKSIRSLIVELMHEKYGENWWLDKVKEDIRNNVKKNIQREEDSGYTIRSEENIDFTTFGELNIIVTSNWEAFEILFTRGKRAFQKIMTSVMSHL